MPGSDNRKTDAGGGNAEDLQEIQKNRALLRERYLRALFAVANKPCSLRMYEKTEINATLRSSDIETTTFQVSNLETPMGVYPEALIRASDILTITVSLNCEEEISTVY